MPDDPQLLKKAERKLRRCVELREPTVTLTLPEVEELLRKWSNKT